MAEQQNINKLDRITEATKQKLAKISPHNVDPNPLFSGLDVSSLHTQAVNTDANTQLFDPIAYKKRLTWESSVRKKQSLSPNSLPDSVEGFLFLNPNATQEDVQKYQLGKQNELAVKELKAFNKLVQTEESFGTNVGNIVADSAGKVAATILDGVATESGLIGRLTGSENLKETQQKFHDIADEAIAYVEREYLTDAYKAKSKDFSKAMTEAGNLMGEGNVLDSTAAFAKAAYDNPVATAGAVVSGMVPAIMLTAIGMPPITAIGITEGVGAAGSMEDIIEQLSDEEIANTPEGIRYLKANPEASPEEIRTRLMNKSTTDTAFVTGVMSAYISKFTGGGITPRAAGKATTKATAKQVAKETGKEIVEETLTEGSNKLAENIVVQTDIDKSRKATEGVVSSAAQGGFLGGIGGSAVSAPSYAAQKVKDTSEKLVSKTKDFVDSKLPDKPTSQYGKTAQMSNAEIAKSVKDISESTAEASPEAFAETVTKARSIIVTLREKQATATPEQAEQYEEQITQLKAKVDKDKKAIESQEQKAAETVVTSEPTPEEEVAAFNHLSNPNTEFSADLSKKLSGSKALTDNQRVLAQELGKVDSPVRKALSNGKSVDDVNYDVIEGSEGFTGLKQYMEEITGSIQNDDKESTAYLIGRLNKFKSSHGRKLSTGKFKSGDDIPADILSVIRDEQTAIGQVLAAMSDTAKQKFPDIRTFNEKPKSRKVDIGTSKPTVERTTVPSRTRKDILDNALATVLHTGHKAVEGTEDSLRDSRIKLNAEFGFNEKTNKELRAAIKIINTLNEKPHTERTSEEKAALNKATSLVDESFKKLVDSYGSVEALRKGLSDQWSESYVGKIFDNIPTPNEVILNEEQLEEVHKPERLTQNNLKSKLGFDKYNSLVESINKHLDENPDKLNNAEVQTLKNGLVEINELTADTKNIFNNAVELFNKLEIVNTTQTSVDGNTKATGTTPKNRTFQNTLDSLPFGSKIYSSFKYAKNKVGLLHTEENLFSKLSDTTSDVYKYLTQNMNARDIEDLTAYKKYMVKFERALKASIQNPSDIDRSHKEATVNALIEELTVDGQMDDNLIAALGSALANWFNTSGSNTLYNDKDDIDKLLQGKSSEFKWAELEKLTDVGLPRNLLIRQLGANVIRTMGYQLKDSGSLAHMKQLEINLGTMALVAGMNANMFEESNVHIDDKNKKISKNPKTGSYVPYIKVRAHDKQVEGTATRLIPEIENAIQGASNTNLFRDILGVESDHVDVYMDGDLMPDAFDDERNSPRSAKAINKHNEIKYVPHTMFKAIREILDPDYVAGLIDAVPLTENEHINNKRRNQAGRDATARTLQGIQNIYDKMEATGSKTVRFLSKAAAANKRVNQGGTDGNPQSNKLVREEFVMEDAKVTIDPKNTLEMLAFKLATTEAIGAKYDGKGTDKSTDAKVELMFTEMMKRKDIQEAIETIRSGEFNKDKIQAVLGINRVKASKGSNGTALKLHGLIALAAYDSSKPFEVILMKENDGITNGMSIGLLQLMGANSLDDYIEKMAKTGVFFYQGDPQFQSFPQYKAEGNKDSYETFADRVKEILTNPLKNPFSDKSILPSLNPKYSLFKVFVPENMRGDVKVPNPDGSIKLVPRFTNKFSKLNIDVTEFNSMTKAANYFLNTNIVDENGNTVNLLEEVLSVTRDFAKDPLMIFNYGAGIKGLKLSVANSIHFGITSAIEKANLLEGDAREEAFLQIEKGVEALSFVPDIDFDTKEVIQWKINRDAPLITVVGNKEMNRALVAVEFTYGAAMEKAFADLYPDHKSNVDHLIVATRMMTLLYKELFDAAVTAKLEKTGNDSLTLAQEKEIVEELKSVSPMIATAMSEDRFKDGIYVPKHEVTSDSKAGNSKTDVVKVPYRKKGSSSKKGSAMKSVTYSNKIEDVGVGMGARMIQSLDASVMTELMLDHVFTNVHDAAIFNGKTAAEQTVAMNEILAKFTNEYDLMSAVLEPLAAILNSKKLTPDMKAKVAGELAYNLKNTLGVSGELDANEAFNASVQALIDRNQLIKYNKKVVKSLNTHYNQYHGSDSTGKTVEGTKLHTLRQAKNRWKSYNEPIPVKKSKSTVGTKLGRLRAAIKSTNKDSAARVSRWISALKEINYGSQNEIAVLDRIEAKIKNMDVKVVTYSSLDKVPDEHKVMAKEGAGAYDPRTRTVFLFTWKKGMHTAEGLSETLFHELDHAATTDALYADAQSSNPSMSYKGLEQLYTALNKEFSDNGVMALFPHLNSPMDATEAQITQFNSLDVGVFGNDTTRGIAEMLAWGKTNKDFRRLLQNKQYQLSNKSWLDVITLLASRILGINIKQLSVYEAMIGLSSKYYNLNTTQVTNAPTLLQYTSNKAVEVEGDFNFNDTTVVGLFDELGTLGSVKSSESHSNNLKALATKLAPIVDHLKFKIFATSDESSGDIETGNVNLRINTRAMRNNIEMSAQETYVHELTHAFLANDDRKKSWAYKEMNKEYHRVMKHLKPEHFMSTVENPTAADIQAAQERYDHTIHNSTAGKQTYKTFLEIDSDYYNADPVEEFSVMAVTNADLANALKNMNQSLKEEPTTTVEKLIGIFTSIFEFLSDKISGLSAIEGDVRMVRLMEHLIATENHHKSLLYKASQKFEDTIDDVSDWASDKVKEYTGYNAIKFHLGTDQGVALRKKIRQAIAGTTVAKNNLVTGIYNEFTTGRKSLEELTRLLSKSTYLIERKGQKLQSYLSKQLNELFPEITEEENTAIYKRLLQTGASDLLVNHTPAEIMELLTNKTKRNARIAELIRELHSAAPTAAKYMITHAEDLGYHMATGGRLYEDGKYTNALQIANLWGYSGKKGNVDTAKAEFIIDELASLHAIGATKENITGLFDDDRYGMEAFETLLVMHSEITDIAKDTTFKDNLFNMRKGYIREQYNEEVDIVVGTEKEAKHLLAQGYIQLEGKVKTDPRAPSRSNEFYFAKKGGAMSKYLTGIMSTANPEKRGTGLFVPSIYDSETDKLNLSVDETNFRRVKQLVTNATFTAKNPAKVPESLRGAIAQPVWDSNGGIKGYRYIMTNHMKDTLLKRQTDFTQAIGFTMAGINRRIETKNINEELIRELHNTYVSDFNDYPDEFVEVSPDVNKDIYNLIPDDAQHLAQELWGEAPIRVKRTQMDMSFGYRKFSVGQLRYNKDSVENATQLILREANNVAALMFNNKVGLTVEEYWQAFVTTAKDTIVIKSGVVTAGNITSNIILLWWSGISPIQAVKDHAEAYKGVYEYNNKTERVFVIGQELLKKTLTDKQRRDLTTERSVLRQDIYNNPVRELIEAGMYQTIVDDIDTSEHATALKDKVDLMMEPISKKTPAIIRDAAKNVLLTHDTKAYKVMRDIAQISDFAARYSLHKKNLSKGMPFNESIRDITTTFISYDIPTHKGIQYLNDMGLMGFTKYFFRIQQVLIKRFGEAPARMMLTTVLQSLGGREVSDSTDAIFGIQNFLNRWYSPEDWVKGSGQAITINWAT